MNIFRRALANGFSRQTVGLPFSFKFTRNIKLIVLMVVSIVSMTVFCTRNEYAVTVRIMMPT